MSRTRAICLCRLEMNWLNSAVKRFSAEVRGRADSLSAVQRDWITFRRTGKVLEVAVERGVRPGDPKSLLSAPVWKRSGRRCAPRPERDGMGNRSAMVREDAEGGNNELEEHDRGRTGPA